MRTPKWLDTSSHSRSATDRTPTSWTLGGTNTDRIIVHRHLRMSGTWFVSCYSMHIDTVNLQAKELEAAKEEALKLVAARIRRLVDYYKKLGVPV